MPRDIHDLEKNAIMFWAAELAELERNSSIIPKLIETQDKFISLLNVADANPFAWKNVILSSKQLPANLFLKHLMVLSDVGGEKMMRFKRALPSLFANDTLEFVWNEKKYTYKFQTLSGKKNWNNVQLKVDGIGLATPKSLTPIMEDIINLILFGGLALTDAIPDEMEEKCVIGNLIGHKSELDSFVKQRYIWVSRITGGATSNSLGNLAQKYVIEYLEKKLPNWNFKKKQIPKISQNSRTLLSYDIVGMSPSDKYCAIEVCFQVTTNSVIERKAGQAQSRQQQLHKKGHHIAYIIDGAGNFERSSALRAICQFSDCTVTFKESELDKLVKFLFELEK